MFYTLKISSDDGLYHGLICHNESGTECIIGRLELMQESQVTVKGQIYSLGQIVNALVTYNKDDIKKAFDERGQLEIGHYLYQQIFGKLSKEMIGLFSNATEIDLHIVSEDEHIKRLPWVLLSNKGVFFSTIGWAVTLSTIDDLCECEMPPSPRVLIVVPEPSGVDSTGADNHVSQLHDLLSMHDRRLSLGQNLQVCSSWEDFLQKTKCFDPQVVYYYGHGLGDTNNARLIFSTREQGNRVDKPIADFALVIRQQAVSPRLVYVNCCSGDSAGLLGAGTQLGSFVPAVITNRTIAFADAAQLQAYHLFDNILLKGIPPHKAVSNLYSRMGDVDLSLSDARWMTPVLHRRYSKWHSNPPRLRSRTLHDPHWHLKVDRVSQFSIIATQARQMLRDQRPRSLAFIWYGQEGQGVEVFHQRLGVDLQESLSNTRIYPVKPTWPPELVNPDRSFTDMLTESFEVNYLDDIPARIRAKTHGASGLQTLVYVCHEPLLSSKIINPKSIKTYLEWWDTNLAPLLDCHQFVLLGISFVVKNPPLLLEVLESVGLEDLFLEKTVLRVLNEMERLARRDLLDFLRSHNILLPIERRERVLKRIMEKTAGSYDKTIEELKSLLELAWDLSEDGCQVGGSDTLNYDY